MRGRPAKGSVIFRGSNTVGAVLYVADTSVFFCWALPKILCSLQIYVHSCDKKTAFFMSVILKFCIELFCSLNRLNS